ncbi:protein ROOT INITIATION DEFECTIVE 3 [Malania oleifera]|uniref:protein ROOT INITIATION DEFECTIVE 3 n=1 Tax=Malania oleifera TaxID=397392 RepID=UPI0025AD9E84|nr:protein ROOT INITIATION DEFECTIVE 3 [Malania oleifera]
MEVVIASSSIDAGISCWDLHTGVEQLRYRSCASPPHGLLCIAQRFLASSQLRDSPSSSGSILYWSWHKPQVGVKSFPAEAINPLVSNHDGTYIIGGGVSGHIYLWEVATGRLLKRWHGHYRAVSCLVLSDDESLLISGADDGCVRVWSLFMIFDDLRREEAKHLYEHSFSEHTLRVTDIVTGYGGSNAIIVSASEDRTCKVWSLSKGRLLRNILFPSIIDAIALDPGEHVFYAGGRDGKIYIAALNVESTSSSKYGMHIIGSLFDHSKAITCLAFGMDGVLLVSGSEDGMIRVWDTKMRNIIRIFKHSKAPINNVLVVRRPCSSNSQVSQASLGRRQGSFLPPPLGKYANSSDENIEIEAVIAPKEAFDKPMDAAYLSAYMMNNQMKELQQLGSAAAVEVENERLQFDCRKSMQMVEQWKRMYENLHEFCVNELLDGNQTGGSC